MAQQESMIADFNTEIAAYENHVMELKRALEATTNTCRAHESELSRMRAAIEVLEHDKSQVRLLLLLGCCGLLLSSLIGCVAGWTSQLALERDQLLDRLGQQEAAAQKQAELIQFINKLSAEAGKS
jgi:hypothetical protein